MNLNKAFVLGRLTADPQVRSTPSGQQVASFSVATNRVWYNQNKEKQEAVEYHNIVVWGRQAEVASKFLAKGGLVLVEGRLQTRNWQGKDGQQRKTTESIVERTQLGPRASGGGGGFQAAPRDNVSQTASVPEIPTINVDAEDDVKPEDLPF